MLSADVILTLVTMAEFTTVIPPAASRGRNVGNIPLNCTVLLKRFRENLI